jgi:hypothetical protein
MSSLFRVILTKIREESDRERICKLIEGSGFVDDMDFLHCCIKMNHADLTELFMAELPLRWTQADIDLVATVLPLCGEFDRVNPTQLSDGACHLHHIYIGLFLIVSLSFLSHIFHASFLQKPNTLRTARLVAFLSMS